MNHYFKTLKAVLLILVFVYWIPGCTSIAPKGKIYVDSPEVFTRERLVNQRLQERKWLEGKFDMKDYEKGFQGYRGYRGFTGLAAGARATYNPLVAQKITAKQIDLESKNIEREAQLKDIEHRMKMLELQHEYETLKKQLESDEAPTADNVSDTGQDAGNGGDGGDTPPADTEPGNGEDEQPPSETPSYWAMDAPSKSDNLATLPDLQNKAETRARPTGLESVRSQKAFRDGIHAMLRETDLDDAHDLYGKTIYTLKFDVTLHPGKCNDSTALVSLNLKDNPMPTDADYEALYNRWREDLDRDIRKESLSLQVRFHDGLLTQQEKEDILNLAVALRRKGGDYKTDLIRALQLQLKMVTFVTPKTEDINKDIRDVIYSKYNVLSSIVMIEKLRKMRGTQYNFYDIAVNQDLLAYNDLDLLKVELARDIPSLESMVNKLKKNSLRENAADYKKLILEQSNLEKYKTVSDSEKVELTKEIEKRIKKLELVIKLVQDEIDDRKDKIVEKQEILDRLEELVAINLEKLESYKEKLDKEDYEEYLKVLIGKIKRQQKFRRFIKEVKQLEKKALPYVYTVEPKEYAQKISDLAATERLKNLVLSLKALTPKSGIEADGYLNYMKRSQQQLETIKRRPLVVGYISGKKEFGWLMGPRFEIAKGGKLAFRHIPVQQSFQASIIVPGWYTNITLDGHYSWNPISLNKEATQFFKDEPVRLPGNMSALTQGLFDLKGLSSRKPVIEIASDSPIILQSGKKEHIMIWGKKLWKNPEIYIGTQIADKFKVLPHMGGLLVTFNNVLFPTGLGAESRQVNLTVITSEGVFTLPKAVTILPPKKEKKAPGKIEILTKQTHPDSQLKLSVPLGLIKDGIRKSLTKMRIRPKGAHNWIDLGEPEEITLKKDKAILVSKKLKKVDKDAEMEADVQLKKGDDFVSIPKEGGVNGTFIHFKNADDFKMKLVSKSIECTSTKNNNKTTNSILDDFIIEFNHSDLFVKAYPGLSGALKEKLTLEFTSKAGNKQSSSSLQVFSGSGTGIKFNVSTKGKNTEIRIKSDALQSTGGKVPFIDWLVGNIKAGKSKMFSIIVDFGKKEKIEVKGQMEVKHKK